MVVSYLDGLQKLAGKLIPQLGADQEKEQSWEILLAITDVQSLISECGLENAFIEVSIGSLVQRTDSLLVEKLRIPMKRSYNGAVDNVLRLCFFAMDASNGRFSPIPIPIHSLTLPLDGIQWPDSKTSPVFMEWFALETPPRLDPVTDKKQLEDMLKTAVAFGSNCEVPRVKMAIQLNTVYSTPAPAYTPPTKNRAVSFSLQRERSPWDTTPPNSFFPRTASVGHPYGRDGESGKNTQSNLNQTTGTASAMSSLDTYPTMLTQIMNSMSSMSTQAHDQDARKRRHTPQHDNNSGNNCGNNNHMNGTGTLRMDPLSKTDYLPRPQHGSYHNEDPCSQTMRNLQSVHSPSHSRLPPTPTLYQHSGQYSRGQLDVTSPGGNSSSRAIKQPHSVAPSYEPSLCSTRSRAYGAASDRNSSRQSSWPSSIPPPPPPPVLLSDMNSNMNMTNTSNITSMSASNMNSNMNMTNTSNITSMSTMNSNNNSNINNGGGGGSRQCLNQSYGSSDAFPPMMGFSQPPCSPKSMNSNINNGGGGGGSRLCLDQSYGSADTFPPMMRMPQNPCSPKSSITYQYGTSYGSDMPPQTPPAAPPLSDIQHRKTVPYPSSQRDNYYDAIKGDLIDEHVQYLLNAMCSAETRIKNDVERIRAGKYVINGRQVALSWDGELICHDGPSRQPLRQYLENSGLSSPAPDFSSSDNLGPSTALSCIPKNERLSFPQSHPTNRLDAMKMATQQAVLREYAAQETLNTQSKVDTLQNTVADMQRKLEMFSQLNTTTQTHSLNLAKGS